MTKVLITGIGGFTGAHLTQHLLANGEQVFGFDQPSSRLPSVLAKDVYLYSGDIRCQTILEKTLAEVQPDIIYHLAGILKSANVEKFYKINVLGTVALFEAIVRLKIAPKVLVTSSSAVYGKGFAGRPITEQFKLRPITHYGVSKISQEAVAFHYHLVYNIPVFCIRAFNLIGPGQPPTLACSVFAQQIALLEKMGQATPIMTGNVDTQRDFTDVRDVVRAYDLIAKFAKAGLTYNICSERAVSIKHCLARLLEMAHISLETKVDIARWQANDVPIQVGSAARLFNHVGWQPEITLEQSLTDLLNDWRQKIKSQTSGELYELAG